MPLLLRCIQQQDYPASLIEWVVVDDGVQSAEAICCEFANTRYIRLDPTLGQVPLGRKRNLCHQTGTGEIFLYMDDDDYYPPTRISHAVAALMANPNKLIAGSSALPMYFVDRDQVWILGPYGQNHATAATFAFRRALLERTSYDETARCSEERHFLQGYTIPMVQLESRQTILAMAHPGNTYDKRQLISGPSRQNVRRTNFQISEIIKDPELRAGYLGLIPSCVQAK